MKKLGIIAALLACLNATTLYAQNEVEPKILNPASAIPELNGTYAIFQNDNFVRNGKIDKYGISLGFPISVYSVEKEGNTTNLYVKHNGSEPKPEGECIEGDTVKEGYCYKLIQVIQTGTGKYTLKEAGNEIKIEKI